MRRRDPIDMNQHFVTLLSNDSGNIFHNNTIAHFTNLLSRELALDGEWEVGIAELSFPEILPPTLKRPIEYVPYESKPKVIVKRSVPLNVITKPAQLRKGNIYISLDNDQGVLEIRWGHYGSFYDLIPDGGSNLTQLQLFSILDSLYSFDVKSRLSGRGMENAPKSPKLSVETHSIRYIISIDNSPFSTFTDVLRTLYTDDIDAVLKEMISSCMRMYNDEHAYVQAIPFMYIQIKRKEYESILDLLREVFEHYNASLVNHLLGEMSVFQLTLSRFTKFAKGPIPRDDKHVIVRKNGEPYIFFKATYYKSLVEFYDNLHVTKDEKKMIRADLIKAFNAYVSERLSSVIQNPVTKMQVQQEEFDPLVDDIYIYTDIIQPAIVGSTSSRLMRIVSATQNRHCFKKIYYHPVEKTRIESVEVMIADSLGRGVPFKAGMTPSRLVLHFRSKRNINTLYGE
nr:TPA_asm: penton [Ladona dragonfly adintovirus]